MGNQASSVRKFSNPKDAMSASSSFRNAAALRKPT